MSRLDNPFHDQEAGRADSTQDTTRIDDVRIGAVRPLISPALLQDDLPVPLAVQTLVEKSRVEIADILQGRDDRLVVVVGPCSIHDHDQALEYAHLLKATADELRDDLLIVMRVYFEKPRTTVGWKGYINDPLLDGTFRINEGLRRARQLLLEISGIGLPTGTEFLDLLSPQYIADLIAWGAIGARTTESQSHRQLASGLSCPIGFKNGTDGGVQIAADAIVAAQASHAFMGMTKMGMAAIFETRGNADAHVILRGGKKGPNYDSEGVAAACAALKEVGLREQVMIDCSHANSGKSHLRQIEVGQDIARQLNGGDRRIIGVMIESHLEEGRQDLKPGVPLRRGVSITDACLAWTQTEPVLQTLAAAVRERRKH
ncbi:Phospho-2-dehydro-3-deoxyheptonate aldolase, Phe-sensitive (plasmid) [Caballeronia sp. SBC1]|uniref:3-deoxy-7-phosphoheptulonate synthase n=1 Tax=unclassified Caballeronia TaxID=2646786 RepID=UPI0013E1FD46|nr:MULTISPECIES: 3-deoxy-7-phosphoheptulonate synthase [unclassified Caballeronia]QIE28733.1 Phospho-2-dehydro-3-deoxyheptonate aldolase, Phe-sensitive [Caballeronia sp. SBC2]QIN66788.1 Phospho-2-dehydro-3-deoxyheptonate aldolase, Phe-sensitive [Caballeronia sp. SBC1]